MNKLICIVDRDRMLSEVYPATGDQKEQNQVRAVELAREVAIKNDPQFKGKISLSNHTLDRRMIVISFKRELYGR